MDRPKTKNWGLQAALCGGVLAWQTYDMATATEAPRQVLALLQYFLIGCGLIGFVGALVMMARGGSTQG